MRRFIVILVVLALVGGGIWYVVVRPQQQNGAAGSGTGFKSFFSLGSTDSKNTPADTGTLSASGDTAGVSSQTSNTSFSQVSAGPVAGFTAYTTTKTVTVPATDPKGKPTKQTVTNHIVRYVSRSNGYVYEIVNGGIPTQITNIFIPNVYEASFADNNTTAILRFLRDDNQTIATYSIPIPEQNTDGTRTQRAGTYLPDNIKSIAISPDQKSVERLTADATLATITTSDSKGGGVKTVLQNPFHEWQPLWANQLYLQTKPSATVNGFLYRIDTATKRLVRILGDIPGMTASVSPKGTYILYSQSSASGIATSLGTIKTGVTKNVGVSILPEKCTWLSTEDALCAGTDSLPSGSYPDDWYKGLVSFSDKLYHIYPTTGIIDTLNGGAATAYDMTALSYDETQKVLYFIDKNTGFLWSYTN